MTSEILRNTGRPPADYHSARTGSRSLRGRLQWWYGTVYAISILVFGGLVYWRADRDTHERALLQAVGAAQYLDVSLRSLRPDAMRLDAARDQEGRPIPPASNIVLPEFSTGPLPHELPFRPPRDARLEGRPADRNPRLPLSEPSPLQPDDSGGNVVRGDRPHPPRDRRPYPDRDRGDSRIPGGPQGIHELNSPPSLQLSDVPIASPDSRPRPPVDRMQFVVWRPNGSVLSRSEGMLSWKSEQRPLPKVSGQSPQFRREESGIEVLMRGPHETTILVLRPMEHDLTNLHRFGYQIAALAAATLFVGLLGGWWISGRIVQPIQIISETAARMSATSLDHRIPVETLDRELVPLATVLNTTFGRLEQSFGRLTQFTADASHELRTPLAVIQSQAELALSQPRTPEYYQQALETCLRSAERMRSLVDGLLLLARTDSERLQLQPGPVDLRLIVEDAVMQLQEKSIAAGVELECRTSDEAVLISADPVFLGQVPFNLIDNAIQHTPPGGKITVDVRSDETDAVLSVQDTGYGILPEHVPHLFERFYRIDVGRSRRHGGSGLGLAICRSLVEAHQGRIHCHSVPGKGSTFTVQFPLLKPTSTAQQEVL